MEGAIDDAEDAMAMFHQVSLPDELELKRELSARCHGTGVTDWEPLVKAIFDWVADAKDPERVQRVNAVSLLYREVALAATKFEQFRASKDRNGMNQARERIHWLLKDFVDRLPVKK